VPSVRTVVGVRTEGDPSIRGTAIRRAASTRSRQAADASDAASALAASIPDPQIGLTDGIHGAANQLSPPSSGAASVGPADPVATPGVSRPDIHL
jgi:hypothetical protein